MDAADLVKSVECPVCLEVFKQPKCLPCGHCVCEECVRRVNLSGGMRIACPVCRTESLMPSSGFPTNYALAAVVEQVTSAGAAAKYKCLTCSGNFAPKELYVCGDCAHRIYCSHCAIDAHGPHQLTKLTAAMQKHNDDKAASTGEWMAFLVDTRPRLREVQQNVESCRLGDVINEHFARNSNHLVWRGEMLMALLNVPCHPTPTGAFPPFAVCDDLQRQSIAHAGHVQQHFKDVVDVLRPVVAIEGVLVHIPPPQPPLVVALPPAGRLLPQEVPPLRHTLAPAGHL